VLHLGKFEEVLRNICLCQLEYNHIYNKKIINMQSWFNISIHNLQKKPTKKPITKNLLPLDFKLHRNVHTFHVNTNGHLV
jgi:hypothetical protein